MHDYKFPKPVLSAVDELIQFIDNNPLNRESISTLFPHYFSNRNTIYAAFEAVIGKLVKDYRAFRFMEAAATLVTEKNLTMRQIAYRCGYRGNAGASNFSRDFKKVFKMTPKEWQARVNLGPNTLLI